MLSPPLPSPVVKSPPYIYQNRYRDDNEKENNHGEHHKGVRFVDKGSGEEWHDER
jgi:hypothetical protein